MTLHGCPMESQEPDRMGFGVGGSQVCTQYPLPRNPGGKGREQSCTHCLFLDMIGTTHHLRAGSRSGLGRHCHPAAGVPCEV